MITLDEFDEKVIKGFFASTAILLVVLGLFSTIIQPAYAQTSDTSALPSLIEENLSGLQSFVFILTEILVPGIFIWFSLHIVLKKVPLLKDDDSGNIFRRWLQLSLTALVLGSHVLALYGGVPLTFDVVYQVQTGAPALVWFVATFFLVSLFTGVLNGGNYGRKRFQSYVNKAFFFIGIGFLVWLLFNPISHYFIRLARNLLGENSWLFSREALLWANGINIIMLIVSIIVTIIVINWLGFFNFLKEQHRKKQHKSHKTSSGVIVPSSNVIIPTEREVETYTKR